MRFFLFSVVCAFHRLTTAVGCPIPNDVLPLFPLQYEGPNNNQMSFINRYTGLYTLNNSRFYVNKNDSAVVFKTFVNDKAIPGTGARTEMSEVGNNFAFWPVAKYNVLTFEGYVSQCNSPRKRFALAQVWIAGIYHMVVYDRGQLQLFSSVKGNSVIVPSYTFGDRYRIVFSCIGAVISATVEINQRVHRSVTHTVNDTLTAKFKFGTYIQVDKPVLNGPLVQFCENRVFNYSFLHCLCG